MKHLWLLFLLIFATLVPGLGGRGWDDLSEGELREMVAENPDNDTAHYYLALILDSLGRCDEAASELRKAIRANPGNMDAMLKLSEVTARIASQPSATEDLHLNSASYGFAEDFLTTQADDLAISIEVDPGEMEADTGD